MVEEQYNPDRTLLTLSFEKKHGANEANNEANDANHEANEKDIRNRIIDLLRSNPKITQIELAEQLHVSRATVQRAMKDMSDAKRITRIGSTRGFWRIEE